MKPSKIEQQSTLVIESIRAEAGRLLFSYTIDGTKIERGIVFPQTIDLTKFAQENVFIKLSQYCALADSIYLFNIHYFDHIDVPFEMSQHEVDFFEKVFFYGLAEFRYTNNIDIKRRTRINATLRQDRSSDNKRVLDSAELRIPKSAFVLNGGGKDGVVAMEIARNLDLDLSWFSSVGARSRSEIVSASEIHDNFVVDRIKTKYALEHSYKGHKPMSLYIAMVSLLSAYVSGKGYVIAANEYSANFPNISVESIDVNHQYSKSLEFEQDLRDLLAKEKIPLRYFSIVRPLYELQIVKIFSKFDAYHEAFISCNQAIHDDAWCLSCPKCAFVIGAMFCFAPEKATKKWGTIDSVYGPGSQLTDETIELINPQLKPLDCIGTTDENRLLLSDLLSRINLAPDQRERYDAYLSSGTSDATLDLSLLNGSNDYPEQFKQSIISNIRQMLS